MSGVGTPRTQESICNQKPGKAKPGMIYRGDKHDELKKYIYILGGCENKYK